MSQKSGIFNFQKLCQKTGGFLLAAAVCGGLGVCHAAFDTSVCKTTDFYRLHDAAQAIFIDFATMAKDTLPENVPPIPNQLPYFLQGWIGQVLPAWMSENDPAGDCAVPMLEYLQIYLQIYKEYEGRVTSLETQLILALRSWVMTKQSDLQTANDNFERRINEIQNMIKPCPNGQYYSDYGSRATTSTDGETTTTIPAMPATCSTCSLSGYYIAGPDMCVLCSGTNFYIADKYTCKLCDNSAGYYLQDQNTCILCDGWFDNDGGCQPCPPALNNQVVRSRPGKRSAAEACYVDSSARFTDQRGSYGCAKPDGCSYVAPKSEEANP